MDKKNIFETASDHLGKKSKKNKESKVKSSPAVKGYADRETQEMMNQVHQMGQDLQEKMKYIEGKCESLGPNLTNHLKENVILTSAEVNFIKNSQGVLGEKILNLLGQNFKNSSQPQEQAPASPANRKHKTLGFRKKMDAGKIRLSYISTF